MTDVNLTFDEYVEKLKKQGYEIRGLSGLKYAFKMNKNQPLDEVSLKKFAVNKTPVLVSVVQKVEPKIKSEVLQAEAVIVEKKPEQVVEPKKEKKKKAPKLSYDEELTQLKEEYKDSEKAVVIFPNRRVFILKEAPMVVPELRVKKLNDKKSEPKVVASPQIEPEKKSVEKTLPPSKTSLSEKYVEDLEIWTQHDLDAENKPKREVTHEVVSDKEVKISLIPSKTAEKDGDSGAYVEIKAQEKNTEIKLRSYNKQPLGYEYFYQLLLTGKKNGLEIVVFNEIKTPEFRDKLLAAALELGLKLENAPEGIDITAAHIEKLPEVARKKLREYNKQQKVALNGKKPEELTEHILLRKKEVQHKKQKTKAPNKPVRKMRLPNTAARDVPSR